MTRMVFHVLISCKLEIIWVSVALAVLACCSSPGAAQSFPIRLEAGGREQRWWLPQEMLTLLHSMREWELWYSKGTSCTPLTYSQDSFMGALFFLPELVICTAQERQLEVHPALAVAMAHCCLGPVTPPKLEVLLSSSPRDVWGRITVVHGELDPKSGWGEQQKRDFQKA